MTMAAIARRHRNPMGFFSSDSPRLRYFLGIPPGIKDVLRVFLGVFSRFHSFGDHGTSHFWSLRRELVCFQQPGLF